MKMLLLASLLFAVPLHGAEPATKPLYRISGIAVSSRDNAPIPYCRMQISESNRADPLPSGGRRGGDFDPRPRRPEPTEVEADVHGRFQINVDHAGAYILTGSAREYRRQNFDAHENYFSSVVLTAAAPIANVTFRMERDASITGLVLDEAGEPVRAAQVIAELPGQPLPQSPGRQARGAGPAGRAAGYAQTDDRGRYELSGLAPGGYRIEVSAQPWYAQGARFTRAATTSPSLDPSLDVVYPNTWFPGVEDESNAELVEVTRGEERQADFHLTPTPSVHLVVPRPEADVPVSPDAPVRGVRGASLVRISPAGEGFGGNYPSSTNGSSQEFGGLSPGTYEIRTTDANGRSSPEARQFRVLPGQSGVVDLSSARPLTKVTLKMDGAEPREASRLTFVESETGRIVSPDGMGGFGGRRREANQTAERAVYLSAGKWQVRLGANATTYLAGLEAIGATLAGSTLNVGDDPATLTLHLGSGHGEVAGVVAAAGGKPVQGAMVLLVPATLGRPDNLAEIDRDQTNTDGSFLLRSVVPGKYILLAIDHGWNVKWRDLATLGKYLPHGVPVEVLPMSKVARAVEVTEP